MTKSWRLKRTRQCKHCPWRVGVNPHDIPNGYSVDKHQALASTIAEPGDITAINGTLHAMACHETHEAHCVGWLNHQLGVGNNLALRMQMLSCENANEIRTYGPQHRRFEDTLPKA